jgi:hypothetical protein
MDCIYCNYASTPTSPKSQKKILIFNFFYSNSNYHVMSHLFLYLYVHHFCYKSRRHFRTLCKPFAKVLLCLYLSVSTCFFLCNCTQTSVFGILLNFSMYSNSVRYTSQHFVCISHMYDLVSVSSYISCHVTNCAGSSLVIGHQSQILYQNDILLTATLLSFKCRIVVFSSFLFFRGMRKAKVRKSIEEVNHFFPYPFIFLVHPCLGLAAMVMKNQHNFPFFFFSFSFSWVFVFA